MQNISCDLKESEFMKKLFFIVLKIIFIFEFWESNPKNITKELKASSWSSRDSFKRFLLWKSLDLKILAFSKDPWRKSWRRCWESKPLFWKEFQFSRTPRLHFRLLIHGSLEISISKYSIYLYLMIFYKGYCIKFLSYLHFKEIQFHFLRKSFHIFYLKWIDHFTQKHYLLITSA